jgi:hypothetical protein
VWFPFEKLKHPSGVEISRPVTIQEQDNKNGIAQVSNVDLTGFLSLAVLKNDHDIRTLFWASQEISILFQLLPSQ